MNGNGALNFTPNKNCINFRYNLADYYTWVSYTTAGNEGLSLVTKNLVTAIIFANGYDAGTKITEKASSMWQDITAALLIKNNKVIINKKASNDMSTPYELEVNGTTYLGGATSINGNTSVTGTFSSSGAISEAGTALSDKYQAKGTYLKDYGADVSRPNGTTFTTAGGTNPVSMRSGATSGSDIGIFSLTDDNAYLCNSSDCAYLFATFDTDKTADFSTADNAAFVVLSNHAGIKLKGDITPTGRLYGENWAIQSSQPANRTTWYNTGTRV